MVRPSSAAADCMSRATVCCGALAVLCFFFASGAVAHAEFWAGTIDAVYDSHWVDPGDPRFGWLDPEVTIDTHHELHYSLDQPLGGPFIRGTGHGSVKVTGHYDYRTPAHPCPGKADQFSSERVDIGGTIYDDVEFEVAEPGGDGPGGEYWIFTHNPGHLGMPTTFTDDLCEGTSGAGSDPGMFVFAKIPGKHSDAVIDATDSFDSGPTTTGWDKHVIEIHLKRVVSLIVSRAGAGTGTVKGGTIDCGLHCTEFVPVGTQVALTPTPAPGSSFDHWEGACTGSGNCIVQMNQDKHVTAFFESAPVLTVALAGSGSGTVTGDGVDCGLTCTHTYPRGTKVALTPTATAGSSFDHWEGACSGNANCTPTMLEDRTVTAVFERDVTLWVAVQGAGSVAGCRDRCAWTYPKGTTVALDAMADPGVSFDHWEGACLGVNPSCAPKIDADTQVKAVFTAATITIRQTIDPPPGQMRYLGAIQATLGHGENSSRSVVAGTYDVVQQPTAGMRLKSIICDAGGTPALERSAATFQMAAGQHTTCTFVNVPDPWYPLVRSAANGLQGAVSGGTAGFFEQILNIVCGSARSQEMSCDQMTFHYAGTQWASDGVGCAAHRARPFCWVFNVFDGYLPAAASAASIARKVQRDAVAGANSLCKLAPGLPKPTKRAACSAFARTPDAQVLYAGSVHFHSALEPFFHRTTLAVLVPLHSQRTQIRAALTQIRAQHEDLVNYGIVPGFDEVYAAGGVSKIAQLIAQWTIPFAARCFREDAIYRSLRSANVLGKSQGARYYDTATVPSLRKLYHSIKCTTLLKIA
jgi:hypothetical protein